MFSLVPSLCYSVVIQHFNQFEMSQNEAINMRSSFIKYKTTIAGEGTQFTKNEGGEAF